MNDHNTASEPKQCHGCKHHLKIKQMDCPNFEPKKVKIVFYATDQTEAVFDGDTCIYQPDYTDNYKHYVSAVEWCKKNGYDYERVNV